MYCVLYTGSPSSEVPLYFIAKERAFFFTKISTACMQHWQGEELARGWGYRLPAWGERWSRKVIDNFGDNGFQTTTGQLYKELLCHTKVKQGGMPGVLVESHTKQSQMHCLWVHTWFTIMIRSYTGGWVGAKTSDFFFCQLLYTLTQLQ